MQMKKSGKKPEIRKDDAVQIAIVGKPNSGKSTLMNYLAKKVVLSHKGNVIYKSKASGGSVFGFWIPIVGSPDK